MAFPNKEQALKFDVGSELKKCFSSLRNLSNSFIRTNVVDFIGLPVVATTPALLKRIGQLWVNLCSSGMMKMNL
jgi:hypothetical protein